MYNLTRDLLELDPEAIRSDRDDEGGGLYPLGPEGCAADFNGNNVVNAADLVRVPGAWGACS